jgi:hypothetical protein
VNEKKYIPGRGAVNFPVCKFMAFPSFTTANWNGIGILAVEKPELRWT